MSAIATLIGNDTPTLVLGTILVVGVLAFAWFDYRRTSRLPHLGTVMVKKPVKQPSINLPHKQTWNSTDRECPPLIGHSSRRTIHIDF